MKWNLNFFTLFEKRKMEGSLSQETQNQWVSISSLARKILKERVINGRKPQEIARFSTSELFPSTKAWDETKAYGRIFNCIYWNTIKESKTHLALKWSSVRGLKLNYETMDVLKAFKIKATFSWSWWKLTELIKLPNMAWNESVSLQKGFNQETQNQWGIWTVLFYSGFVKFVRETHSTENGCLLISTFCQFDEKL